MVVARCPAPRRDGRACGTLAATPEVTFCRRHEALAEKWGEERVRSGDYPGNAPRKFALLVAEPEPEVDQASVESNDGGRNSDPGLIRPALAQLAADNLNELQRTLLDAALSATTTRWATVRCTSCQTQSRVELPAPDVKSRLQAIQLLLSESLGRAPTAPEIASPAVPDTVAEVERMSWAEMQQVFALTYIDDLQKVAKLGGREALRKRLADLSVDEQRVLREALLELEVA
jgi:hypothetical protein